MVRRRPGAARKAAREASATPPKDRTTPRTWRLRPSSARRAADRVATPRRLRSRFRRVRPRVSTWRPTPRPTGHTASGVRVTARFSRQTVTRVVGPGYLGQDTLDRWAAIEAGVLPADDTTPRPPTPDQVDERETELIAAVEAWGRDAEAAIREAADDARADAYQRADQIEDDAAAEPDGRTRAGAHRRADRIRDDADDEYQAAQAQMDGIADQVREQRTEIRTDLTRQVETMTEVHDERIAELQGQLDNEVLNTVNSRYFITGEPNEITEWSLTP